VGDQQGGAVQQREELRATAMTMNFISIGSSPKSRSIHEPPSKIALIVLVETTLEWCIYDYMSANSISCLGTVLSTTVLPSPIHQIPI
jgi:hypothetical protein